MKSIFERKPDAIRYAKMSLLSPWYRSPPREMFAGHVSQAPSPSAGDSGKPKDSMCCAGKYETPLRGRFPIHESIGRPFAALTVTSDASWPPDFFRGVISTLH